MRKARLIWEGRAFYHVIARVIDSKDVFGDEEKTLLLKLLRVEEAFTGVRVLNYCLMSDHFHVLLEVPDRESLDPLDESALLAVLPLLHDRPSLDAVRHELESARVAGDEAWHREILNRYERRRGQLSCFLKEVKMRVTGAINRKLDRKGTLWEGRYRSVLVEDSECALLTMSAYIDLNPIRSGIVDSPELYPWCGYAEAVSGGPGSKWARERIGRMLEDSLKNPGFHPEWSVTEAHYRNYLFDHDKKDREPGKNEREGRGGRSSKSGREQARLMTVPQALRRPVRYFCDGAVLGSTGFVNAVFEREQAERNRFGGKRKTGARKMKGADWGELRVLRDLQKDVFG